MGYTPLDSGLLTSTLLREGPDVVAVWALVLASANKLGQTEIQPSAIASLLRIPDDRVDAAFKVLLSPDPRSRNQEHQGRRLLPLEQGRWFIVSHQKYQWRASRAAATARQKGYDKRNRELEEQASRSESKCDVVGCFAKVDVGVNGRQLCSNHAFEE